MAIYEYEKLRYYNCDWIVRRLLKNVVVFWVDGSLLKVVYKNPFNEVLNLKKLFDYSFISMRHVLI